MTDNALRILALRLLRGDDWEPIHDWARPERVCRFGLLQDVRPGAGRVCR